MTDKPEALKVGTNSLKLPFPNAPQGNLSALKSGGVKSAQRIKGDKARLKNFIQSLRILEAFAKETYVKDVAARNKAKENSIAARARVTQKRIVSTEAKAVEYEKAAKRLRDQAAKLSPVKEEVSS